MKDFVRLFNREEFWESHEALEDAWRATGSDFYQGLILYASAFVHAQRGVRHGVLAQLDKAERRLQGYRPAYLGVDVEGILNHVERCRRSLEETGESGGPAPASVPFPRLELQVALIRGDERELAVR